MVSALLLLLRQPPQQLLQQGRLAFQLAQALQLQLAQPEPGQLPASVLQPEFPLGLLP